MKLLVLFAAAAPPVWAQCSYTLTAPGGEQGTAILNLTAASYSATVNVNTSIGCAWAITQWPSWVNLTNGSGTGGGSFTWTATANVVPVARQGQIVFQGNNYSVTVARVTQAAQVCNLSLPQTSAKFGVAGGTGAFAVNTNCLWSLGSNAQWVSVTPLPDGTTAATVNYTAAPNGCATSQTATLVVSSVDPSLNTAQYQISEDGAPGNLSISPGTLNAPATASSGRASVITGNGCGWSAYSDVSWLHITSGDGGSGPAPLAYSIDANPGVTRTGNIHVGAATLALTQQGAPGPTVQLTLVANAASYAQGAVSPGEIVAIGGSNMGPVSGVSLQVSGKSVSTSLGGTQVLFDGTAAALTYSSGGQVNAVVPYGVAGKQSTQVQVQYQNGQSNTMTLAVQAGTPGIFTVDSSGSGQGAIQNQDYTLNGRFNPAARGSVIQIYCTGGGVTNPATPDATLTVSAEPFPRLTQNVTVTIGGIVSPQVYYAGGAPGEVGGLTQINAMVPNGVTPGGSVPITVQIGNQQSQLGVTVAVM
ncbi:MAG TPA: BACON domain-containing carbohydrate-binding protein [Bryobacteraceae bacterium]|nr:BACON domain-containing carbohydrate-binding protein [Bryobacteraceae bacterium]